MGDQLVLEELKPSGLKPDLLSLAQAAGAAMNRSRVHGISLVKEYLEASRALAQAREQTGHGEWSKVLEVAGIAPKTARRMVQLANSGLEGETVAVLGGVKQTLQILPLLEGAQDPNKQARLIEDLERGAIIWLDWLQVLIPLVERRIDELEARKPDDANELYWLHEIAEMAWEVNLVLQKKDKAGMRHVFRRFREARGRLENKGFLKTRRE